jgi:uncharacterized lipoprotein NlpE involved in copper resistance
MTKSITILLAATAAILSTLGGCNNAAETMRKVEAPTSPSAPISPDKPTTPDAVSAGQNTSSTNSVGTQPAAADASVSASGTEARAGDVSVKLPD